MSCQQCVLTCCNRVRFVPAVHKKEFKDLTDQNLDRIAACAQSTHNVLRSLAAAGVDVRLDGAYAPNLLASSIQGEAMGCPSVQAQQLL